MTEVTAMAKNIRISPKKVRLVVNQIRKMKPKEALDVLEFTLKSPSLPLKKVIFSAVSNAKNNLGWDEESLAFKSITVGKGPVFKRFRPVSRGRAHSIFKRTSHITVKLTGSAKKQPATQKTETKSANTNMKEEK
jgi:large subunit ribosomal protein L22